MKGLFHHLIWLLRGISVFALVGKSGTGKSFRAKLVAQKYGINLIVDDGLLIRDNKIIAGKSAKREKAFLGAIRTAIFDDTEHRKQVQSQLRKEKFKRILIIGTSINMVKKIAERLDLPAPSRIIKIEDVASQQEIERAIHSRKSEGKHVIPVPALEIRRNYPHIFYDSVRIFLKNKVPLLRKSHVFEKAVVRPQYSNIGKITISQTAITQMIMHCINEYDNTIKINKVVVKSDTHEFKLGIHVQIPFGTQLSGNIHNLQQYIKENIERYTGIVIKEMNITIENIS
ncbi:MAG: hypothetical protein DRP87_03300 [Spirochaetes bacterium]|nr:MAG: hypothetical protein DRP87_03300 [Spirochaetota bacterium]